MGDVRLASPADGPRLAALRSAWAAEEFGPVADPSYAARFDAWWAVESGRRLSWLAYEDPGPVGMVNLAVFERMPRPGRPPSRWGYLATRSCWRPGGRAGSARRC